MNRLLIRNILALIVYTGFFAVQLKANFLIQENIKFRNDFNCLTQLDKCLHSNCHHKEVAFHKTNKNLEKHKKSNMNRRFIPENIKHLTNYTNVDLFVFNATPSKAALRDRILSISLYELEDRGPPAIV